MRLPIEILEEINETMDRLLDLTGIDETGIATVGIYGRDGEYHYGPAEDSLSALLNEMVDLRDELAAADEANPLMIEFELDEEDDSE